MKSSTSARPWQPQRNVLYLVIIGGIHCVSTSQVQQQGAVPPRHPIPPKIPPPRPESFISSQDHSENDTILKAASQYSTEIYEDNVNDKDSVQSKDKKVTQNEEKADVKNNSNERIMDASQRPPIPNDLLSIQGKNRQLLPPPLPIKNSSHTEVARDDEGATPAQPRVREREIGAERDTTKNNPIMKQDAPPRPQYQRLPVTHTMEKTVNGSAEDKLRPIEQTSKPLAPATKKDDNMMHPIQPFQETQERIIKQEHPPRSHIQRPLDTHTVEKTVNDSAKDREKPTEQTSRSRPSSPNKGDSRMPPIVPFQETQTSLTPGPPPPFQPKGIQSMDRFQEQTRLRQETPPLSSLPPQSAIQMQRIAPRISAAPHALHQQHPSQFHRYPTQSYRHGIYQQQRLPLGYGRQQQQHRGQSRWKVLWNRVEQGLDGLANLEEQVAYSAKRVLNVKTVKTAKRVIQQGRAAVQGGHKPQPQKKAPAASSKSWNDLLESKKRIIAANGGASSAGEASASTTKASSSSATFTSGNLNPRAPFSNSEGGQQARTGTEDVATASKSSTEPSTKRPPIDWHRSAAPRSSPSQRTDLDERPQNMFPEEDDYQPPGLMSRLAGLIVSPLSRFKRRSSLDAYAANLWDDADAMKRKQSSKSRFRFAPKTSTVHTSTKKKHPFLTPPVSDLHHRCHEGKNSNLLSHSDKRTCYAIGRGRALMDVMAMGLLLFALHEAFPFVGDLPMAHSLVDFRQQTLPTLLPIMKQVFLDSWAPFALVAAYLTLVSSRNMWEPKLRSVAATVGSSVQDLTLYNQLYLRLVSALPLQRNVPQATLCVSKAQVYQRVQASRLQSFVLLVISCLLVSTVSVIQPVAFTIFGALGQLITLPQLKHWPVSWSELRHEISEVFNHLGETVRSLLSVEAQSMWKHPERFAVQASVTLALVLVSRLPSMLRRRNTFQRTTHEISEDKKEHEATLSSFAQRTENLNNVGVSSASRLNLQANSGSLESTLERWRQMLPQSEAALNDGKSVAPKLKLVGYLLLASIILAVPATLGIFIGGDQTDWQSLANMCIVLLFTWGLASSALSSLLNASDAVPAVTSFLKELSDTISEVAQFHQSPKADMQLAALISPTKGVVMKDVWAAHASRRAWALRGVNLQCRNGEVTLLLGDEGAGKTRLLTILAEAAVLTNKKARSATRVRGTISVGGIEVSKWDKLQLKRRIGLFLNDVRTVADFAELLSGLTLEEILEPIDTTRNINEPHNPGSREKNAMTLALKVTGLYSSLIPRLPFNLSTVVTANEDELKPSPLRPHSVVLSPCDWSRVLFTKILAQAIYDNENQAASANRCLLGSMLVLDDAMIHMSEAEEARFMAVLRRTGAATILTSHRWSAGRLADRIIVLKDGAVVETGNHETLLRKGPQHGTYAAQWHSMSTR